MFRFLDSIAQLPTWLHILNFSDDSTTGYKFTSFKEDAFKFLFVDKADHVTSEKNRSLMFLFFFQVFKFLLKFEKYNNYQVA